ncbi:phosphoserine phosphatase RsbU [bacterium BMS3Abin04]|nr:phosphoserine phosphatase RsbU [bacterium BMS3Abin04]
MTLIINRILHASTKRKLENAVLFSILIFIYKIFFPATDNLFVLLLGEIFILITLYLWAVYVVEFIRNKTSAILSVIVTSGIFTAIVIFIVKTAYMLFSYPYSFTTKVESNFFESLFNAFLMLVLIVAIAYIFQTIKTLFFLRQKRNPSFYFNLMVLFFIFTALAGSVEYINNDIQFLVDILEGISISLILMNSFRVAWIAFLTKKQKISLLGLSIIMIVLFAVGTSVSFLYNFPLPALTMILRLVMIYGIIYYSVIFFTTLFHIPTAAAIDRKTEELSSFMDLNSLINQVFDINELSDTVTKMTRNVCNCEAAWLATSFNEEDTIQSVNSIGYLQAENITSNLRQKDLLSHDINTFNLKTLSNEEQQGFESVVVAPLKMHGKINGYLFAARENDMFFDDEDKKSISAFADYAALALENAKLIQESIEKERLEKELDVAREIQRKILPKSIPKVNYLDIASLFIPAFEVGGDYYDFFELDNENIGFIIADVSGKSIQAAFIMAEVKGIFKSLSGVTNTPKELFIKANEILKESLDRKSFVTATYGILNIKTGKFSFCRAGHSPIMHYTNNQIIKYIPQGIGLGIEKSDRFASIIKEMEIQLNYNDILILFTDGINESQNKSLEEYGYNRLEKVIKENKEGDMNTLAKKIIESVSLFSKDSSQHDDITLVLFKWKFNNKSIGDN